MTSEISNISIAGAGMAAPRSAAKSPPTATSGIQVPEAPKVQAPKPVEIRFDQAEVRQSIQDAVKLLNQQLSANNRGLAFSVDEAVNSPVVTVRSTNTGEVVRQIPSEIVVKLAHSIDRMKGILFNEKT